MMKSGTYFPNTLYVVVVVDRRAPPLIYSGHKSADFKYWLAYNKSSVLVIIIYTCRGGLLNKSQCYTKKSPTPVKLFTRIHHHKNQVKSLKHLYLEFYVQSELLQLIFQTPSPEVLCTK